MKQKGFVSEFKDVWILGGMRTPMVDYCGALGHLSPTDLGIKAARAALVKSGVPAQHIDSVIAGNMAPRDFDQFVLPRHIGLCAGVPQEVPAIMVQRICGTGFELFRQSGEQILSGAADVALLAGTESMTRHPIAAFDHRAAAGEPRTPRIMLKTAPSIWKSAKSACPGVRPACRQIAAKASSF